MIWHFAIVAENDTFFILEWSVSYYACSSVCATSCVDINNNVVTKTVCHTNNKILKTIGKYWKEIFKIIFKNL